MNDHDHLRARTRPIRKTRRLRDERQASPDGMTAAERAMAQSEKRPAAQRDSLPDKHSTEHHETLDAMERFGGGFVQALAVAWRKADALNHAKLHRAFGHYYRQYQEASRKG